MTHDALRVLERAASISRQTIKLNPPAPNIQSPLSDGLIAARHLLAAFLTLKSDDGTGVFNVLSTITDENALRQRFFDIIEKSDLVDDRDEWRSILQIEPKKTKSESEWLQKSRRIHLRCIDSS